VIYASGFYGNRDRCPTFRNGAGAVSITGTVYNNGGWARVIFKGTKDSHKQDGPFLFLPSNGDCMAEAITIQNAMMLRNRPPGCTSMACTP
jgi:hypothetical protein